MHISPGYYRENAKAFDKSQEGLSDGIRGLIRNPWQQLKKGSMDTQVEKMTWLDQL